jgi:hypothetical protein
MMTGFSPSEKIIKNSKKYKIRWARRVLYDNKNKQFI